MSDEARTAFDAARRIVEMYGDREHLPELPMSKRDALACARALLSYEPTTDALEKAREIVDKFKPHFAGSAQDRFIARDKMVKCIAAAIRARKPEKEGA